MERRLEPNGDGADSKPVYTRPVAGSVTVVDIAPPPPTQEVATLISSCSASSPESPCVLTANRDETPRARVRVRFAGDTALIEVEVDGTRTERVIRFSAADNEAERLRTVGFVVGALARPPKTPPPKAKMSPVRKHVATAPARPSGPAPSPTVGRPWSAVDLAGSIAPGAFGGPVRSGAALAMRFGGERWAWGGQLRGHAELGAAPVEPIGGAALMGAEFSVPLPLFGRLMVGLQLGANLLSLSQGKQSASRLQWMARPELGIAMRWTKSLEVLVLAGADCVPGATSLRSNTTEVGRAERVTPTLDLGVRYWLNAL